MNKVRLTILLLFISSAMIYSQDLIPQLKPLEKFVGKTWRGEFANSTAEKPMVDISRWERALNGMAIRILHSVNNGEYGGETILYYDNAAKNLIFYYFTTAGFYTTGTMEIKDNKLISRETVTGEEGGITEVEAVGEIMPDGSMVSTARFLRNGVWEDGHKITYKESPDSEVIFK